MLNYAHNINRFVSLVWIRRGITFAVFLLLMLCIKNKFYMNDEYWFAISLDKGEYVFHNFHILSNSIIYLIWSLITLLGIKISAFYAAQLSSSILSAIGAAALIDLGMFWGLSWRNAILFSLPILLCNAFIRYGTSAYPGAMAMGIGLVAINLAVRAAACFEFNIPRTKSYIYYFCAGIFVGLAALMHLSFLVFFPGLLCGLVFLMLKQRGDGDKCTGNITKTILFYCFGVFSLLITLYLFLPLISKAYPNQVTYTVAQEKGVLFSLLTKQLPKWWPSFKEFVVCSKTFMALFFPGVHSENIILNFIFGIPRIFAFLVFIYLMNKAWKNRKSNVIVFYWGVITLITGIFYFFFLLFSGIQQCRQYAVVSLSVFGPFFLSVFILSYDKNRYIKILINLFTVFLIFYSIFGIEGIVQIITHDNRPMLKLYSHCEVHVPKSVQFPWLVDRSAQDPLCHWEDRYGAFGPGLDYLSKDSK